MCSVIETICGCHEGLSSNALDEVFASSVALSDFEPLISLVPEGFSFDTKTLQQIDLSQKRTFSTTRITKKKIIDD